MDRMVKMETSIWAYPWDLLNEGVETALDRIVSLGLDAVSVAAAYHSGKFLSPRSPHRKIYFPEGGVVYFQPSKSRFNDLPFQPCVSELVAKTDILGIADKHCKKAGLRFVAWLVGTHNTRLASSHLDFAAKNVYGDPYIYALCPSHEPVRRYLTTLVEDLVGQYRFDAIEVESFGYMGFLHGYHHELYSVNLSPFEQALLALCFCPACEQMAKGAGIDVTRLKTEVRSALDSKLAQPANSAADSLAELLDFVLVREELSLFLRKRCEVITALAGDICKITHQGGAKLYFAGPVFAQPTAMGWVEGIDARQVGKVVDRFEVSLYFDDSERKAAEAFAVAGLQLPCELEAALNVGHPYVRGCADLIATAELARQAGFSTVGFYNYGTLPEFRLTWIQEAVKSLRGAL